MIYKPHCVSLVSLMQNLTAQCALAWKRHSYQRLLKLQLRDAF